MAGELDYTLDANTLLTTATTEAQKVAIINQLVERLLEAEAVNADHETRIAALEAAP